MEKKGNTNDEILLEKVFDAGANTIWSEMQKLRGQAPEQKENMRRRWIWELIQNASDCIPKGGKININISVKDEKILEFTHDGVPFTYENLIDLITQISSKQSDSEEKTGKFGTGFISTHLLSEKVKVSGVFKQSKDIYKNLNFVINRSGSSYQDVRNTIKETLNLIEDLKQNDTEIIEEPGKITTKFCYNACSSQETKEAIKIGLEDFNKTIPFVLALNNAILSITCNGAEYKINKCSHNTLNRYQIVEISNPFGNPFNVLIKEENEVSIALLVQKIDNSKYRLLPFIHNTPKLFCKFPLIGTENFSFPVVINCSKFEVEKDRNAIHEGYKENINILNIAIKLYETLINYVCQNKWEDIYNICYLNKKTESSLQKENNDIIEKIYNFIPIVETNINGAYAGRTAIKKYHENTKKIENSIGIPISEKIDFNDEFWELVNSIVKFYIPTKDSYLKWCNIFKTKVEVSDINNWYIKDKNLTLFKQNFHGMTDDVFTWLNKFYSFWIKSNGKDSFISEACVLNQNYKFIGVLEVSEDDNIDTDLKRILTDLGDNITEGLLVKEIKLPESIIKKKINNKHVSKKIQDKINRILSDETINNAQRSPKNQEIFNKLTNWFLEKPKLGEELFEQLYKKRNLLSTPEENIRRFKIAEKIESNNIKYEQLDDIIDNNKKITELIENLSNLSDQEIKQKLKHISAHSTYAMEKFTLIMERSIKNIYDYLSDIDISDYEISSTLEEWERNKYSDTVFPAIKNGKDINIIIRPSDQNKIIFFNDEELEALDDTDYELWTDDEQGNTRMITLGDIIKTTGISVIPLRNIYNN
ncbi:hypothetical protein DWV13_03715 [Clostridium botulinum]|uniref:sacsin N-terminal ATP-binding-like domain-containing protein n=1 Tax=Clostridium TaxID=1485 RepID=UPI0013F74DFF|nr:MULTISPECIES: hypothetical protein [Clostridium]MCS6130769.1 hypothetical protein [Clostridium botulinum]NFL44731.1 hypothetical protein [Clostridium botulinum]NFL89144.1 hypothetical protein [Clostridium botulinum]